MRTPKEILTEHSYVSILPGLTSDEITHFEMRRSVPIPPQVKELLRYSAGFDCASGDAVRFIGAGDVGFGNVIPLPLAIMGDGFGNFWIVDIDNASGAWGVVFFLSHDPAVLAIQAPDIATFLEQMRDSCRTGQRGPVSDVRNEATTRIWKDDPFVVSVDLARQAQDDRVAKFAKELPDNFDVADLRSMQVGVGFSWGHTVPEDIRRFGKELVFGIERKPEPLSRRLWSRLKG